MTGDIKTFTFNYSIFYVQTAVFIYLLIFIAVGFFSSADTLKAKRVYSFGMYQTFIFSPCTRSQLHILFFFFMGTRNNWVNWFSGCTISKVNWKLISATDFANAS